MTNDKRRATNDNVSPACNRWPSLRQTGASLVLAISLLVYRGLIPSAHADGAAGSAAIVQNGSSSLIPHPSSFTSHPSSFVLPPSQDSLVIETMAVEYAFGQYITFRLVARSDAAITAATVFFRAGNGLVQTGATTPVLSQTGAQATYTRDLLGGVLPPFSTVTYWWEVSDASGRKSTTPSQAVDYVDNRFGWDSVAEGIARVFWYEGDQTFGQSALDVTRETLSRLSQDLAAPLPPSVDVYIYGSVGELQSALMMAGRSWQEGQARPDLGVALIAASPGPDALLQLRRELAHELTHLLVYQDTGKGYPNVPRWLDEGLAILNEPSPDPEYQSTLDAAYHANTLIPLETLCAPFPADPQAAWLSYSESQSVVRFIREQYGEQGIRALLAAYRDGASCSSGVERALGVSLNSLELAWRARLGPQGAWQAISSSIGAWVVLAVLLLIAPLPLVLVRRKK